LERGVNINLLPAAPPIQIGAISIDRSDLRRLLLSIVPIAIICATALVGMTVRYEVTLKDRDSARAAFVQFKAAQRYQIEATSVEPQILRLERVHDALASRRDGVAKAITPVVLALNAFPTSQVRLISVVSTDSGLSVTGDALTFEAARAARESLRRKHYGATLDSTTHEESSSTWGWTGTIEYPIPPAVKTANAPRFGASIRHLPAVPAGMRP